MLQEQAQEAQDVDFQSLDALRSWAVDHGIDVEAITRLTRWDHDLADAGVDPAERSAAMAAFVTASATLLEDTHAGLAALFGLIHAEVDEAWQATYRLDILAGLLRVAREHPCATSTADVGTHLMSGMTALLEVLELSILSEGAMTSGDIGAYARYVDTAAGRCAEAEAAFGDVAQRCAPCASVAEELRAFAESRRHFNTALAQAAECARGVPSAHQVQAAVRALEEAEQFRGLADSPLRSELRSHRLSLLTLLQTVEDGVLHVDRGRLTYLYPFAIRGMEFDAVVARLTQAGVDGSVSFAGATPRAVRHGLDLDDIWNGADAHAHRYDGVRIVLPDVVLATEDADARVAAEILLSNFGNHYVRFSREIRDLSASEYYVAASRAAPEHGLMTVSFGESDGGPRRFEKLCSLAMTLVADLATGLGGTDAGLTVAARPGMFQVVASITELSRVYGNDASRRQEIVDQDTLLATPGLQVLTNPVPYVTATPVDWARLAVQNELCQVGGSTAGQVTFRTPNTTVLVQLGAPDWIRDTRSAMAEFAASLDGLLAAWSNELARHFREVRALHDRVRDATSGLVRAGELVDISRELEAVRADLAEFVIEYKSVINAVRSPSLLSSPVAVEELRGLLSKSDFDRRTRDLEIETNRIAYDQMNEALEKLSAKVAARSRAKLEIFLAVIAVAGLSGIVQVVQAGFAGHSAEWEWMSGIAALAISLGAALFGIVEWRVNVGERQAEDRGSGSIEEPAGA